MRAAIFVIQLLAFSAAALAQQHPAEPTLLELAREHGGIDRIGTACGPAARLEDIVGHTQLIIYGTVVAADARFSDDRQHILTEHQVQPIMILYDGRQSAGKLEQTPVFTSVGGSMIVEGLQITDVQKENSRSVALSVGDEVVVMGAVENKRLMLRPTGVFTVAGGAVNANGMVEGFTKDGPGVPLDQFIAGAITHGSQLTCQTSRGWCFSVHAITVTQLASSSQPCRPNVPSLHAGGFGQVS
jgi:hypothetical protein